MISEGWEVIKVQCQGQTYFKLYKDHNAMISLKKMLLSTFVFSSVVSGAPAQASLSGLFGMSGFHSTAGLYTQFIAENLHKAFIPGAVVGIWQPGRPTYLQSFGTADLTKKSFMSIRMAMPIGNITTAFTVRALLDLAKAGEIQLNAPVSQYLSDVPEGSTITVADLAQMRSGLVDYLGDPAFLRENQAHPDARLSPEQLLHYSFAHPLLFKPGSRFDYSNTNTILLGLIIEKVTGKPLFKVINELVLQPYKLSNTTFLTNFADPYLQVQGYTSADHVQKMLPVAWNPSLYWASGAMTATATDLQRWAEINADLNEFAPILAHYGQTDKSAKKVCSTPYFWGSFENHGWVGDTSHLAGFESLAIYAPKLKDTIVILLNSDATENGIPVAAKLAQQLSRYISPEDVYQAAERP